VLSGILSAGMRASSMMRAEQSQRGVALILVLWVAALLTVIAASFAYAARTDMNILGNQSLRARAEAAAGAGLERAVYEAFKPISDPTRWRQDGREYSFAFGDAQVRVSVMDESAKIDINEGSPALLKGMFVSVGLSDQEASQLVDAMQDWRDPDSLSRLNGAETEAYATAGLKQKPANAPFQTVEELRLVYGMTADIFRRIESMITIYSRQPGINVAAASREVLMAIPGVAPEQVDAFIAQRQAAIAANQPLPPFPQAAAYGAVPNLLGLEVRSEATLAEARFERLAILKMIPDPRRPYAVLSWKEGRSAENMNAQGIQDGR
jgi:general secretion pathway protein K